MAQHINAEEIDNKTIQRIVAGIKKQRYFRGSLRYELAPGTGNVYYSNRKVPESLVYGGQATFEVHVRHRPAGDIVEKIYMVA